MRLRLITTLALLLLWPVFMVAALACVSGAVAQALCNVWR